MQLLFCLCLLQYSSKQFDHIFYIWIFFVLACDSQPIIFNNSFKYIRSAFKNGSLNEQEYKAYLDEINNIALYRNSVDDYYEVPSVYDDGNEIYSELDNETKKYYEEPVKYADKNNIETDISYVRK